MKNGWKGYLAGKQASLKAGSISVIAHAGHNKSTSQNITQKLGDFFICSYTYLLLEAGP